MAETQVSPQQNQPFPSEVRLPLQHQSSPLREIHRPETTTRLLRHQQPHPLIGLRRKFRTEKPTLLVITELPHQLTRRNTVQFPQGAFNKLQENRLQILPVSVLHMQLPKCELVIVVETRVEVVPVVQPHPLLRVGLEDLHLPVAATHQHPHVIVLAVGHQSLQPALLGLHQHQVPRLGSRQEVPLAHPLPLPVDLTLPLTQPQFARVLVTRDYQLDGSRPVSSQLGRGRAQQDGVGGLAEAEGQLGVFVVDLAGEEFETVATLQLLAGVVVVEVEFLGCETAEEGLPARQQPLPLFLQISTSNLSFPLDGFIPIPSLEFYIHMRLLLHPVVHPGFILPESLQIIIICIYFRTSLSPMFPLAGIGVGPLPAALLGFWLAIEVFEVVRSLCRLHVVRIYQFHIKRVLLDQCYPGLRLLIFNNSPSIWFLLWSTLGTSGQFLKEMQWRDIELFRL